ncbi:MAG: SDR family oxidoreductase [Candidatus Brocadiae bacterium]|nr:SDR family oxidoreductase [Candidatus Brocadiia bacterium]
MQNSLCLLTGGSSGLGLEITRHLKEKMQVVVLDHALPEKTEHGVLYFACDVCNLQELQSISSQIMSLGTISLLINNVGYFTEKNFHDTDYEEWQKIIHTNLDSAFLVTKAFYKNLTESACIVSVSSGLSFMPEPNAIGYSTAKAALNMFTKCLSLELAPKRVLAIAPGPVQLGEEEKCPLKQKHDYRLFNPMKRFATGEEVARFIWFAYHDAPYLTGTVLSLDGGESALGASWSVLKKVADFGKV